MREFNISLSKKETAVTVKLKVAPINVFIEHHPQTDTDEENIYTLKAHQASAIIIFSQKGCAPYKLFIREKPQRSKKHKILPAT